MGRLLDYKRLTDRRVAMNYTKFYFFERRRVIVYQIDVFECLVD